MNALQKAADELKNYRGEKIKIMEVCGTHTSSIFKNGIRSMISPEIQLISGPGCPVCVTSAQYIDRLAELSLKENHCILTFGDMMKVKGSELSLTQAKAMGADVRIVYSPLSSIKIAIENPDIQFIFAAVGFETTTPIYALMLDEIIKQNIRNIKFLTSLKTIIPAIEYICDNENGIDAFLCPGHVSVITGSSVYNDLAQRYQKPFVVSGFDGEHIIAAVYEIVRQLKNKRYGVKNLYTSAVSEEGNKKASDMTGKYFEASDEYWRGIGKINNSGLTLKQQYIEYDAGSKFDKYTENKTNGCKCSDVILGRISPAQCPLFKTVCNPLNALGPCMVSTEGACGIWYKFKGAGR